MEIERIKSLAGQLIATLDNLRNVHSSITKEYLRQVQDSFLDQSEQLRRELDAVLSTGMEKAAKLNPSEIFATLCQAFTAHTFPKDKESWQDEIVRIFKEIGQKFELDVDAEFLRTDLIWYQEFPVKSLIELAMEHENHTSHAEASFRDYIIPEVDKLRNVKALQKWLVYYPRSEDIDLHLSRIARYVLSSRIKQVPREDWLVLTLTDDSESWRMVQAVLHRLLPNGRWERVDSRTLQPSYS